MYDFYNLIVRSLSETNIAHFYFYEYQNFGYGANSKVIFSEKLFYDKLINTIELCISDSHCNDDHLKKDFNITEFEPDFEAYEKFLIKKTQDNYNEMSIHLKVKPMDWENCSDARKLTEAFQQGLILKEPVKFIALNKDSTPDIIVIRKTKLEYLKSEAIRASKAISADDLDDISDNSTKIIDNNNLEPQNHSKIGKAIDQDIENALEILKPLGGIYQRETILSTDNMDRLISHIKSIILKGNFHNDKLTFPKTNISNQFIRKTIHLVYKAIGKKHKSEFIELIHLFEQFDLSEPSTTNSKFSIYAGDYQKFLSKIIL